MSKRQKKSGADLKHHAKGYRIHSGKSPAGKPKCWWLGHDLGKAQLLAGWIRAMWKSHQTQGLPAWRQEDVNAFTDFKKQVYASDQPIAPQPAAGSTTNSAGLTTLHAAIDACIAETKTMQSLSEHWRPERCRRLEVVKKAIADMPLEQFGRDVLFAAIQRWKGKAKSGSIAPDTALNRIRCLRLFLNWLDETEQADWDKKSKWDKLFRVKQTELETADAAQKRADHANRPLTLEELTALYSQANTTVRLYMLIALNCGHTQAELATLKTQYLHLAEEHPFVRRKREKTLVDGQWRLWPETIAGLTAYVESRGDADGDHVFQTRKGKPLVWRRPNGNRVDAVSQAFGRTRKSAGLMEPYHSFRYLRKTGSQFLRDLLGVEYSDGYLAHRDQTSGKAYNRFQDWEGLAEGLTKFREYLQPMFEAAEDDAEPNDS